MNRDETRDRTERSEWADADFNENRVTRYRVADPYERWVLEELEAPRFFDPASVRWYRSVFSDHNPDRDQDLGDVEFLHERALVVECGDRLAPTRAAVLVFGKPRYVRQVLPRPVIDCQFIGANYDEWSPNLGWTDRIVVEENLLRTWLILAERYFERAERPFTPDMRTMGRDDDPPGYASFREAVVNHLIHQDYGDRWRTPFIRFYRDRTVFWNPGHANVPAGDLLDRTPKGVPNPLIAAAFRRIGLAWQAGIGIPAIFRDWQRLGHAPPVIRSDEASNSFELSLVARVPTGQRRPTVPTDAERADGDGDDDRSADPASADMDSDHGDHVDGDLDSDQVGMRRPASAPSWRRVRFRAAWPS